MDLNIPDYLLKAVFSIIKKYNNRLISKSNLTHPKYYVRNIIMVRSIVKVFLITVLTYLTLTASSITVQGDIYSSTWSSDTVFVAGNLKVNYGAILTIEPGTEVIFEGEYYISVNGRINALGEENNMIEFYPVEDVSWQGIIFESHEYNLDDSSSIVYCDLRGVNAGSLVTTLFVYNYKFVNINNCNIHDNYQGSSGGGVRIVDAEVNISFCNFSNNEAWNGGAISCGRDAKVTISNNILTSNKALGAGGAISIFDADLIVISKNFISKNVAESGAGYRGGGGIQISNSNCYIIDNVIADNKVNNGDGGGISLYGGLLVQNNLIINNSATNGGGIYDSGADVQYSNNTIVNNSADHGGGMHIISANYTNCLVTNSIVCSNSATLGDQIYLNYSSSVSFNYNNIQGGKDSFGYSSTDLEIGESSYLRNIDVDPRFKNPNTEEILSFDQAIDDWSLNPNSFLINSGKNQNFNPYNGMFDIGEYPRIFDGDIDMGISEYQNLPDQIPQINIELKNIDFGIINLNTYSHSQNLLIENIGHSGLNVSNLSAPNGFLISTSGGNYSNSLDNLNILAKSDTSIQIVFNPLLRKTYEDSLRIESNSDSNGNLYVKVAGDGRKITHISGIITSNLTIDDYIFIDEDLIIADNVTLTILPGSVVNVSEGKRIDVKGRIIAEGSEADSIIFTSVDTTGFYAKRYEVDGGWEGIFFDNSDGLLTANDTSKFDFCKIEYCKYNEIRSSAYKGAIKVIKYSKVVINNSLFYRNYFYSYYSTGGAIYCESSSPIIKNNTFLFNYAKSGGGAIFCTGENSSPYISNNIFKNNSSDEGGAIHSYQYSSPIIKHNTIEDNDSRHEGGGIFCETRSRAVISTNLIYRNKSSAGGGISINSKNCIISNNQVMNNYASNNGGGLYLAYFADGTGALEIKGNIIANNTAIYSGGGLSLLSSAVLVNNTIVNNKSRTFSGIDGKPDIYNTILWGNTSEYGVEFLIDTIKTYNNSIFLRDKNELAAQTIENRNIDNVLNIAPKFFNPTNGSGFEFDALVADWSLNDSSLAIDGGAIRTDSLAVDSLDVLGNNRIYNMKIDIGAIESQFLAAQYSFLSLSKTIINFIPNNLLEVSSPQKITINNYGFIPVTTEEIVMPVGFKIKHESETVYSTTLSSFIIAPKSRIVLEVVFVPMVAKQYNETLSIVSSCTQNPILIGSLSGKGTRSIVVHGVLDSNMVWSDSVLVIGDLEITENSIITINPGTRVLFDGHFTITSKGAIKSNGVKNDSIYFTLNDPSTYIKGDFLTGWGGIIFSSSLNGSNKSSLKYTVFSKANAEYYKSTLYIQSLENDIEHCRFNDNYSYLAGAIKLEANINIKHCTFTNNESENYGGAISCRGSGIIIDSCFFKSNIARSGGGAINATRNITISNSTFYENQAERGGALLVRTDENELEIVNNIVSNNYASEYGGGIVASGNNFSMINNLIINNSTKYYGGGIFYSDGRADDLQTRIALFVNNTISNNKSEQTEGGGLYIDKHSPNGHISLFNNIFSGNMASDTSSQFFVYDERNYSFWNCNIQGFTVIDSDTGLFNNNIFGIPKFIAPSDSAGIKFDGLSANWRLSNDSPCLNRGTEDISDYELPHFDIEGNNRVFGKIDLGAYENQLIVSIPENTVSSPSNYDLKQNYPNPFNPVTKIEYSLPQKTFVTLTVFDVLGNKVRNLVNKVKIQGVHEVEFNSMNISSGIYFYSLITNKKTITKKMIVLK